MRILGLLLLGLWSASAQGQGQASYRVAGREIEARGPGASLHIRDGVLDRFENPRSGEVYADLPYGYSYLDEAGRWVEAVPAQGSQRAERVKDGVRISLEVKAGPMAVAQELFLADGGRYWEETLSVTNAGQRAIGGISLGPRKRLGREGGVMENLAALPFGRSFMNPKPGYPAYAAAELAKSLDLEPAGRRFRRYAAEAWAFPGAGETLLVSKLSPQAVEYGVARLAENGEQLSLTYGGAASWLEFPQSCAPLAPGAKALLARTRYELVPGGFKEAFYAYRSRLESLGYGLRPGYAPEVFWNEIFDNPMVAMSTDTLALRERYYTREAMEGEARKAAAMGAKTLYLDPGWDTKIGSAIWAKDRLGQAPEFIARMRERYGLSVGVHTPLPWMEEPSAHEQAAWRLAEGRRLPRICSGSGRYLAEQAERLKALALAGVSFMMFDGTNYTLDCSDPAHGHPIPYTREDHMRSVLSLLQGLHRAFPRIEVELHDPLIAGQTLRLVPMYFLHERPGSFDEWWAGEFMLGPLRYVLDRGPAVGLYYYNLAYSLPLYEHIDLRQDTEGGLAFWWYASTCRHLGLGGTHKDPRVRRAQRKAMRRYNELSEFFKRGRFYGLGETAHAHTLPGRRQSVIVLFNFDGKPARRSLEFKPSDIGLEGPLAGLKERAGRAVIEADLPALGAAVIVVRGGRS